MDTVKVVDLAARAVACVVKANVAALLLVRVVI
jgi:hypothetical protein